MYVQFYHHTEFVWTENSNNVYKYTQYMLMKIFVITLNETHSSSAFLKEKVEAFTGQPGDLKIQHTTLEILHTVGHNVSKVNFHSSKLLRKASIHIKILFSIILLCSQLCYARITFSSLVIKQLTYLNNFK